MNYYLIDEPMQPMKVKQYPSLADAELEHGFVEPITSDEALAIFNNNRADAGLPLLANLD